MGDSVLAVKASQHSSENTMTNHSTVAAALILLGVARGAVAQDSTRTWSFGADNQSGLYVGMAISPTFRLEPEVSLFRQRDKTTITIDNGFGGASTLNEELTSASYRVGLGLLWQWQRIAQLRFYVGPRIGLIHATASEHVSGVQTGTSDASRTDWFVAGSLGAEYFPVPRLSAGADVQLRGITQGSPSQHANGSPAFGAFAPSEPTLSTRGLLLVRFYL
jgi:outer membrane protein with beta-barrel domain